MNWIGTLRVAGDWGQVLLPVGVGLGALYRGHMREAFGLAGAAAVQQVVLQLLKATIVIQRPAPNHHRFDSFPSGHTAGAFLAVGFVFALDRLQIHRSSTAYKVALFALATLVGISRVACQMHWPVDVVGGGAIGFCFGVAGVAIPYFLTRQLRAT